MQALLSLGLLSDLCGYLFYHGDTENAQRTRSLKLSFYNIPINSFRPFTCIGTSSGLGALKGLK